MRRIVAGVFGATTVVLALQSVAISQDPPPIPIRPPKIGLLPQPTGKSPTEKLRDEREALTKEREGAGKDAIEGDSASTAERAKLRLQLAEMLKKLGEKQSSTPPAKLDPKIDGEPKTIDPSKVIDALGLAQSLYKAKNYEAALRAFSLIDTATLTREERVFVQYMTACSLRKTGQTSKAAQIYREVIDSREDEFLTECSLWQLSSMNWRKDLESQLDQLRRRRQER